MPVGNTSAVRIEIRVDDKGSVVIRDFGAQVSRVGRQAEASFQGLGRQGEMFNTVLRKTLGLLATLKMADFAKDTVMAAARYETLGVSMNRAGRNAGYLPSQMVLFEKQLESQGIAMNEAREVLTSMAAAYMDLSKAAELASAAQDVAVAAGLNSSETFASMVRAIKSGEVEILRTLGLNVQFEASYKSLAQQLHKSTNALTEQEKMQARVNVVLEASRGYSALYAEAMTTAGKQITSFSRYWADMQNELGQSQLPAVSQLVQDATSRMKEFTAYVKDPQTQERLAGIGSTAVDTFDTLVSFGAEAGGVLETILEGWNKLPSIIQQVGILGALMGGAAGVAGLAAFSYAWDWADDWDKILEAHWQGKLDWKDLNQAFWGDRDEFLQFMETGESIIKQIEVLKAKRDSALYSDEKEQYQAEIDKLKQKKRLSDARGVTDAWLVSPALADKYTFREPLAAPKTTTTVDDATTRKILDARKDLESARLEFLATAAEQSGDEIGSKLLTLRREYESAVASLRKEMVGAGPEESSALQGVIDYEARKYEIKRGYLEKSLTAEREEQRAEAQLKLAQLQGVDTYEAEIAAIRAKYSKARLQPGSVEGQMADTMEAAEISAKERERLKTAVQLRGEYAQMTNHTQNFYAAQVQLLEIEQTLAKTEEERQVINERLAEATAHRDGDWLYAANAALREYGATATDTFMGVQSVAMSTMGNIEDGFTLMATRGKIEVTDMLRSIQADFTRMMIRQQITGPLAKWASSGGLTSLFAGILHDGGSAATPGRMRLADADLFRAAPRYHTGKSGEVPTILRADEWVFTPQQMAALGRAGGSTAPAAPIFNVYVETENGVSARVGRQESSFDGERWVASVWLQAYQHDTEGMRTFLLAGGGRG